MRLMEGFSVTKTEIWFMFQILSFLWSIIGWAYQKQSENYIVYYSIIIFFSLAHLENDR